MRKYLYFIILTLIVFGTITILTAEVETPFCGNGTYGFPNKTYGFPYKFYTVLGSKRDYYPPNGFSIIKFVIDLTFASFIPLIIVAIFRKSKTK